MHIWYTKCTNTDSTLCDVQNIRGKEMINLSERRFLFDSVKL